MISKTLEKKIELLPDEDIVGYKNPINLEYYLLESNLDEVPEKKVFGIEIIKKVDGMKEEMEFVRNLTCCKDNAKNVLNKLASNTVTPMGLYFVLEDLLGE